MSPRRSSPVQGSLVSSTSSTACGRSGWRRSVHREVIDRIVTTHGGAPEVRRGPSGERRRPAKVVAQVSDLEVTFHRGRLPLYALRGVSVDVRAGEILG